MKKTNETFLNIIFRELPKKHQLLKSLVTIFYFLIPIFGIFKFYGLFENKYVTPIFVIIFLLMFFSYNEAEYKDKRKLVLSGFLSLIYSVFFVYGTIINNTYDNFYYNFLANSILSTLLWIYSFTAIINFILIKILSYLEGRKSSSLSKKFLSYIFPISFIFLIVSWLPYFANFYPGLMSPDSLFQWCQSINECVLTNHHPVVHTLFIKIFSSIGLNLKDPNLGLALYSISQLILMSLIYSYQITYLAKLGCDRLILLFSLLVFSLVPVFGFYSITMWKDVLFGGAVLLLVLQVHKIVNKNNISMADSLITVFSVVLVSLLRSNGLYVVIALVLFMYAFLRKKRKIVTILFLVPLCISIVIKYPVFKILDIREGNFVENLGVPLKQMVGVVGQDLQIDSISYEYITTLVPEDVIKENYNPYAIEPVKFHPLFDNAFLEENKKEFFVVWLRLLKEHPITFIQTYLRSTYGFWYPEAQGYIVHQWEIETNDYGLTSNERFDQYKLTQYFYKFYNYPIIKYFTSDALYFWILIFTVGLSLYYKKYSILLVLSAPLLVFLTTIIATPIAYHPRYTFALYGLLPLFLYLISTLSRSRHNK